MAQYREGKAYRMEFRVNRMMDEMRMAMFMCSSSCAICGFESTRF